MRFIQIYIKTYRIFLLLKYDIFTREFEEKFPKQQLHQKLRKNCKEKENNKACIIAFLFQCSVVCTNFSKFKSKRREFPTPPLHLFPTHNTSLIMCSFFFSFSPFLSIVYELCTHIYSIYIQYICRFKSSLISLTIIFVEWRNE